MMDTQDIVDILCASLAAEQRALVRRIDESTVFITDRSLGDAGFTRRLFALSQQHCAWLAEQILERGGVPHRQTPDLTSADMHFLTIRTIMPRLMADCERLIGFYRQSAERAMAHPEVVSLLQRITTRYEDALTSFQAAQAWAPQSAANDGTGGPSL